MVIVDAHSHFGEGDAVMRFDESPEAFLAHSDKVGCTYLIQSSAADLSARPSFENTEGVCRDLYERSGGRVYSYLVFNPNYPKECLGQLEAYHDRPYIVGIKIHPADHSVWADDEAYRPVWEAAERYHMPIMSHTWALTSNPKQKYATPERFEKYLRDFPAVTFIFGHSGGRTPGIKAAAALGAKYKNAYFDLAGDVYNRGLIEYLASHVGADRIMIGSDIGWFDLSVPIGMVLGSSLTLEEKELILGENALRVFGIGA